MSRLYLFCSTLVLLVCAEPLLTPHAYGAAVLAGPDAPQLIDADVLKGLAALIAASVPLVAVLFTGISQVIRAAKGVNEVKP